MPSGSLLVARMRSRRHSPSTRCANAAADSITCSQLSRISSASRSRIAATSRSAGSAFGASPSRASRRPSAASVGCATSPRRPRRSGGASSTSQAPSGSSPSSVRAVSVASRVFPEPPGPIRVVSRCSATSSRSDGDVGVPADEAGQLGPQVGLPALLPPSQLAPQQRDVQRGQLRRGVDAERVGQGLPRALVHEQRLGVAAGRDEGAHQRGDEPFPYRVGGHRVGQLRDQLRRRGRGRSPRRTGPPSAVRRSPSSRVTAASNAALSGRPTSCMAAPRHSPSASRSSRARWRPSASRACGDEAFEPHGVDRVGRHRQPVAVRLPLDRSVRQRLAQPGDQALQGVRRVGGRVLAPDPVDERRLRDHVTRRERESDQQPAQPGARHVGEDAVVRAHLEWSQHPDLHPADFATGGGPRPPLPTRRASRPPRLSPEPLTGPYPGPGPGSDQGSPRDHQPLPRPGSAPAARGRATRYTVTAPLPVRSAPRAPAGLTNPSMPCK